ncbi:hypothetical protein Nepgr_005808 [Nepenthes gracilis]|uniref:Nodulin-like domain-containing protein n=1 Tax=Nepenthes gracilis TaxID=150966 RepID=A0AAD3S478_NEPGR|nr:hypothetical protein Nepgr_005808 [Nepenthes gracilis]
MGELGKWMRLVASTWIQAFTGTNLDFSAYSSELKSVMGISQLQLSYLSMASDLGKAFGWCSGLSLLYFPLWLLLFIAAFMGLFGYGLQWLIIRQVITLPYFLVFMLCLLAGCSICWFNTVCFVLCIRNFPSNRALALSLSISFNGLTAAIYSLLVNAINSTEESLYLLLNACVPLLASIVSLLPIVNLWPPPSTTTHPTNVDGCDSVTFILLYLVAIFTGLYIIFLNSISSNMTICRVIFAGAIILLVLPISLPHIVYRHRSWIYSRFQGLCFNLVDVDDLELHEQLIHAKENGDHTLGARAERWWRKCIWGEEQLAVLGEEHSALKLMRRWDFWLYYVAYLCGGTMGLAYGNNLGQIVESLGFEDHISSIVSIFSSCSFFGRLLSAAPDFLRNKVYIARTGWLAMAIVATPVGLFLLVASDSWTAIRASTALIGLSSGFVFAAAVSITSELFGPNSAGLNHNILITNIPIGSLLYSLLASLIYDSKAEKGGSMICMGRDCYFQTFIWWGCISLLGLASSLLLFFRTKPAYNSFRRNNPTPMEFS